MRGLGLKLAMMGGNKEVDWKGQTVVELQIPSDGFTFSLGAADLLVSGQYGTFDWGDGNVTSRRDGLSHTYSEAGTYVFKASNDFKRIAFWGGTPECVTKCLNLGRDLYLFSLMFYTCTGLVSVTSSPINSQAGKPSTVNQYQAMFCGCTSLVDLYMPDGFGDGYGTTFNFLANSTSLQSLRIPQGFGSNISISYGLYYTFGNTGFAGSLVLPDGFGSMSPRIGQLVGGSPNITYVELPAGFGRSVTSQYEGEYIFHDNQRLRDVLFKGDSDGICTSFRLDSSNYSVYSKRTYTSLFTSLQDVTANPKTVTIGSAAIKTLTAEELSIATSKGWTVA